MSKGRWDNDSRFNRLFKPLVDAGIITQERAEKEMDIRDFVDSDSQSSQKSDDGFKNEINSLLLDKNDAIEKYNAAAYSAKKLFAKSIYDFIKKELKNKAMNGDYKIIDGRKVIGGLVRLHNPNEHAFGEIEISKEMRDTLLLEKNNRDLIKDNLDIHINDWMKIEFKDLVSFHWERIKDYIYGSRDYRTRHIVTVDIGRTGKTIIDFVQKYSAESGIKIEYVFCMVQDFEMRTTMDKPGRHDLTKYYFESDGSASIELGIKYSIEL